MRRGGPVRPGGPELSALWATLTAMGADPAADPAAGAAGATTAAERVPAQAAPVEAVSAEAVSAEAVSGEAVSAETVLTSTVPTEIAPAVTSASDESAAYVVEGLFEVAEPPKRVKLAARLSPSRAGDFQQCPLLFRFRCVDRLPEPPSRAATMGTLVHAVLEHLYDRPAGQRTFDAAQDLVSPEWSKLRAERPELMELFGGEADGEQRFLEEAVPLLERYFTLENPNVYEPARREWRVDTVIGEGAERVRIGGIIDRVDVAPNGMVRVVDYKTGKQPKPAYRDKVMFQMTFYALVLWRLRGTVPARLQLIFMGSGDVLKYDPVEEDLHAAERKIAAVWRGVRESALSGEWPARPTKLCDWCSFKPICPSHGGTPPPTPLVELTPVPDAEPTV